MSNKIRCWKSTNPLHVKYHDEEWGVPLHDDNKLFEFLALGGFQVGLSWWLILEKREAFRKAFDNFDIFKVASYSYEDVARLMSNKAIVRNRRKVTATIHNAQQILKIKEEYGSFDKYIWKFVNGIQINNKYIKSTDIPTETPISSFMSEDLKKRKFKMVGPIVCYAFMQAVGLVNDHVTECFRYKQLK